MIDLSNYYHRNPPRNEIKRSERFPGNHVKFSSLLKPLQWIDNTYDILLNSTFGNDNLKNVQYNTLI